MKTVHLDTDFGGDPDDACALVMLLGTPDVEIVGITTNLDEDGRRAGAVKAYLELAGRPDIPVQAGANRSMTTLKTYASTCADRRYWPDEVASVESPPGAAVELLSSSVAAGATVVAIGAYTNLALLEMARPGTLESASVVAMGGLIGTMPEGYPRWDAARDWNVQCDTRAAEMVASSGDLTLSTLNGSVAAQLRERDLPRLHSSGRLGELLARQSVAYADDNDNWSLGAGHSALADDLVNFHWDPVACAVATGWAGGTVVERVLAPVRRGEILEFVPSPSGRATKVVEAVDGELFNEMWLEAVERADRAASTR